MENYIHKDAINDYFDIDIKARDWCDVPKLVAKKVHNNSDSPNNWDELTKKAVSEKESRVKKRLNSEVMDTKTLNQLKEKDNNQDIPTWLEAIRERVSEKNA